MVQGNWWNLPLVGQFPQIGPVFWSCFFNIWKDDVQHYISVFPSNCWPRYFGQNNLLAKETHSPIQNGIAATGTCILVVDCIHKCYLHTQVLAWGYYLCSRSKDIFCYKDKMNWDHHLMGLHMGTYCKWNIAQGVPQEVSLLVFYIKYMCIAFLPLLWLSISRATELRYS